MNTGEGPSHDDLTGIPEKPTLREMVGEKDDCLQRIPNRISATLFDNRLAVDAERDPDLGKIEAVPIGAGRCQYNASISEIVGNKQRTRRLKSLLPRTMKTTKMMKRRGLPLVLPRQRSVFPVSTGRR